MDAIGADDQVEGAPGAAAEGHVHPAVVVVEGGDGVVEEDVDVVPDRAVEDLGQLSARDFEVMAFLAAGDGLGPDGGDRIALLVEEGDPADADVGVPEPGEHPHPPDDLDRGAADVDGVAATAQCGRLLDEGDREAVPAEPVGQRGTGDAGAGDQDRAPRCGVHGAHGRSSPALPREEPERIPNSGILFLGVKSPGGAGSMGRLYT
ncbi:hypothetical protein SVIO_015650 [Streptomyces violaceusniger]|uniref:Uncharacterized protein n=1 Tax=Streptomyces violaceusniger TaxID=68280 RepID=A0A4D4KQM9_STRVO|nr:hypothetical protein SVIO_015650 [Streptomyces violaceusniger]